MVYSLILFNLLLFANSLNNDFTFDDREYILYNPHVQRPDNLPELFTHPYPPHKPELSLYRPLVEVTYLVDWSRSLKKSDFSALNFKDVVKMHWFHLTNIFIHVISVIIIFFLVRRIFESRNIAFVAALVFSAHPVHVETVTSLVGRAESMSAVFYLLALFLFVAQKRKDPDTLFSPLLLGSYFSFFLALLSKESAITLPVAILLTDWFLYARKTRKFQKAVGKNIRSNSPVPFSVFVKNSLLRMLPFAGVFVGYMIIRLSVLQKMGITEENQYFYGVDVFRRLASMCIGFLTYIRLLIFPVSMSVDYNFPVRVIGPFWAEAPKKAFFDPWAALGLFAVISYIALSVYAFRKKKDYAYPLLFFAVTMFPFSNILPFGDFIAERFLYLPSLGFCILIALGFRYLRKKEKWKKPALYFLIVLLLLYSVRTFLRNRDWRDGVALWRAEEKWNPESENLASGLGGEYALKRKEHLVKGNASRAIGDYEKAAHHLELAREFEDLAREKLSRAVKQNPEDILACYNYGHLCMVMRNPDFEKAEEILEHGVETLPPDADQLHVFYYFLGIMNMKKDNPDPEKALRHFKKAHKKNPKEPNILIDMAGVYAGKGDYEKAAEVLKKALKVNPAKSRAVKMLRVVRRNIVRSESSGGFSPEQNNFREMRNRRNMLNSR